MGWISIQEWFKWQNNVSIGRKRYFGNYDEPGFTTRFINNW